jgi:hypothetical protein
MTSQKPKSLKPVNWEKLARGATALIDPRDKVVTRRGYMALRRAAAACRPGAGRTRRPALTAAEYLAVCDHLDRDPMTQGIAQPGMPDYRGAFSRELLAAAVLGRRMADGLTMEQAARRIGGCSAATLCRMGQGRAVSPDIVRRACAWLGKHPNEFTVAPGTPASDIAEIVSRLAALAPQTGNASENNPFQHVSHVEQGLADMANKMAGRPSDRGGET